MLEQVLGWLSQLLLTLFVAAGGVIPSGHVAGASTQVPPVHVSPTVIFVPHPIPPLPEPTPPAPNPQPPKWYKWCRYVDSFAPKADVVCPCQIADNAESIRACPPPMEPPTNL